MIYNFYKTGISLFLILFSAAIYAQSENMEIQNASESDWFISAGFGVQMSGIKDEDFVSHNIAPLVNITAGKWFSPELALQIGYKGFYYNAIADDIKHNYTFIHGDALFNLHNIFSNKSGRIWNLCVKAGAGYYYNYDYSRPNVCANLGVLNSFQLTKKMRAFIDASAIVGWDIYQGDEDILPGVAIGVTYLF